MAGGMPVLAPQERPPERNDGGERVIAKRVQTVAEKEAAKRAKVLRAREKADKQEKAALRLARKRKLEEALAEKMKARSGVKKKTIVRCPAVELTKARLEAKKKSTLEQFFLASRNKSASGTSNPITCDESGPDEFRFRISGQDPQVITVSGDTMPPASGCAGSDHVGALGLAQTVIDLGSGGSEVAGSSNSVAHAVIDLGSGGSENAGSPNSVEDGLHVDVCDLQELSLSDDNDDNEEASKPVGKKQRKNYDSTCKFQMVWAVKLPWAEAVLASDGVLQMVKCTICSDIDKKPCILGPKWDTLTKHEGRRKAKIDMPKFGVKKGQSYIVKDCRHRKNMRLHLAKKPTSILQ